MIPKELKRDACGRNRLRRVEHADQLVDQARRMAEAAEADPDNGFAEFADPYCDCGCVDPSACGAAIYRSLLEEAATDYRRAGLGVLAGRVDVLRFKPLPRGLIADAWEQFDKANAVEGLHP